MAPSETLVFLAGKRTPFGANGGALRDASPVDLTLSASQAAFQQAGVEPGQIDHVIVGNVLHSAPESIYVPRHLGLKLGIPTEVPALGINRLCGSGFQVVIEAFHQMLAGDTQMALVAGVENMSMSPYLLRNARWGAKMGNSAVQDMMVESLYDLYAQMPMAMTAENLAEKYEITRQASDVFAILSQTRYKEADAKGYFKEEIAPYTVSGPKGDRIVEKDEHPKPQTTLEKLSTLKALFKKDGTVTAGNASGIVDGAAVLIVSTEKEANKRGLKPLGRLVAYGISGCDPTMMGIGPVPAARIALKRAGLKITDMDLVEVNEAFAPQALSVQKELEIPDALFNVNGGAIAVGHPLAASGTRIIQNLLYELRRRKKKRALGSACIGGGQGIALIIESL